MKFNYRVVWTSFFFHDPSKSIFNDNGQDLEYIEYIFIKVGEAYAILSDEKKKRAYDSGQDLDDMGGCHAGHDIDPNTIFQVYQNRRLLQYAHFLNIVLTLSLVNICLG